MEVEIVNQNERCLWQIKYLLSEDPEYANFPIPDESDEQKRLLRALLNVREAAPISEEFLKVQDEYLAEELKAAGGVVDVEYIPVDTDGIGMWQGDITHLKVDAIVNAANNAMTGCYAPNHLCIDNAIHTFAGVRLRNECDRIMKKQGHPEPTGQAKITPAYDLPSKYVIHTVGPIINNGVVSPHDEELLRSSYISCLDCAAENGLESIAFCCISTGVFAFPKEFAAQIAVDTVRKYRVFHPNNLSNNSNDNSGTSLKRIIFNVFGDDDARIYRDLLN